MNGPVVAALFYGAKTLPVKRGAGVDHEVCVCIEQCCGRLGD